MWALMFQKRFLKIMGFNLICEFGPESLGGYKIALESKTPLPSESLGQMLGCLSWVGTWRLSSLTASFAGQDMEAQKCEMSSPRPHG